MEVQTTSKRQITDITDDIDHGVPKGDGIVHVFVRHTTAAVTIADLDPGTDEDFLDFLTHITPNVDWRHPHDPSHAPDHLLASMIGPDVTIPYRDGRLMLGTWQRIILVELDGPKQRDITLTHLQSEESS